MTTFTPSIVCVDFETALLSGEPSVEFFRKDFRAISVAASWRGEKGDLQNIFLQDEIQIRRLLARLDKLQTPLIAHNIGFEMGVSKCRFPDLTLNWSVDTQRLVQVYDGGNPDEQVDYTAFQMSLDAELALLDAMENEEEIPVIPKKKKQGLALEASINRILPEEFHEHKQKAYQAIVKRHPELEGKKLGAYLNLLTEEELKDYNIGDTDNTLRLYEFITNFFEKIKYNWKVDHSLYIPITRHLMNAKIRGVQVDREGAIVEHGKLLEGVQILDKTFKETYVAPILKIKQAKLDAKIDSLKLERYKQAWREKGIEHPDFEFNVGSTKQLSQLFVGEMGIEPKFHTAKGAPSFRASHLGSYGEAGAFLTNRKKHLLVANQLKKLLLKSEYDHMWHMDLKTAAAASGRFAGAGGLNVQGLARRSPELMERITPADPSNIFFATDIDSAEPTVVANYSLDPLYIYASFTGKGKEPYWENGVLMIGDIYLMCASISPVGRFAVEEAWKMSYDGLSFAEQWVKDKEVITSGVLKKTRTLHKIMALALAYGVGWRKMVMIAYDNGFILSAKDAKAFHKAYWQLFKGVRKLADSLSKLVEKNGCLINPFGFRMTPEPHKALNYLCQSTVTGGVNLYTNRIIEQMGDKINLLTIIHDEPIFDGHPSIADELKIIKDLSAKEVTEVLNWKFPFKSGWKTGETLYDLK